MRKDIYLCISGSCRNAVGVARVSAVPRLSLPRRSFLTCHPPLPPHPLQPSPAASLGFLKSREGAGHLASSRGPTGLWASLGTAKHVGGTGVMSSCGWQASAPPKLLTFLRPAYFISSSDPLVVRGPSVNSKPAGHFPKPRHPKHIREPASAVPCITLGGG